MDKIGVEPWEEQDEELYALLEKAMSEEPRLTVSEELIQKTLKRVEEIPVETGSKEKSYKRFYRPLRYACVAAAAVLVVAVGVKTLGNGGFSAKDSMEAEFAPEAAMRNDDGAAYMYSAEAESDDNVNGEIQTVYHYVLRSTAELADEAITGDYEAPEGLSGGTKSSVTNSSESIEIAEFDAKVEVSQVKEQYGESTTVELSDELVTLLEDRGVEVIDSAAIYWDFEAKLDAEWERLFLDKISETDTENVVGGFGQEPYFTINGSVFSEQPLQFAVQVQTTKGELWFMRGEELYLLWR